MQLESDKKRWRARTGNCVKVDQMYPAFTTECGYSNQELD